MFEPFFNFVINKSVKLPDKLITFIFFVLCLLIVDNIIGYTYYGFDKRVKRYSERS